MELDFLMLYSLPALLWLLYPVINIVGSSPLIHIQEEPLYTSIINEPDIVSTEDDVFHDSESVESEAGIDIEVNSSSESEMTVLPEEDSADKSSGSKISHEGTADFMPTDIEDFEDNLPFI